jgi:hypothetical protein
MLDVGFPHPLQPELADKHYDPLELCPHIAGQGVQLGCNLIV